MKSNLKLNIHYDVDGCIRDFHNMAYDFFFGKYPELKKYVLPINKFTGWNFDQQVKPGKMAKIMDELFTKEIFWIEDNSYKVFSEAKPFITPQEWQKHLDEIWSEFPNARIVFSTHQYNNVTRMATTEWLQNNGFVFDDDKIDILYTGAKNRFGAHFLLDDKVPTIEEFHKPHKAVGVLRLNPSSNGWYQRKMKGYPNLPFPTAKTLNDYKKIIFDRGPTLRAE